MEIALIIVLIVLCLYGFAEQERNFKALGERIEELKQGAKNTEQNSGGANETN